MAFKDKETTNAYYRKDRKKHPEKYRAAVAAYWKRTGRFRVHGIGPDEFEAMYLAQGGKCAICKKDIPYIGKETHIDHDHKTNKIRGLLCAKCNMGIGHFDDDTMILEAAIKYLRRSS
jgi:hypothetical protein